MWRWTRIEEGQEKREEMLNQVCYVILETLNTHLDKLVMAAILFLLPGHLNFYGSWCLDHTSVLELIHRTLIEFINRIGFDVPYIALSLVLLDTGDS